MAMLPGFRPMPKSPWLQEGDEIIIDEILPDEPDDSDDDTDDFDDTDDDMDEESHDDSMVNQERK